MKKYLPYLLIAVGIGMGVMSQVIRHTPSEAHSAITNLSSSFILISGCLCIVIGFVVFFRRDDEEW